MKEQVSQEEAKEYAESIGAYFRLVSAKKKKERNNEKCFK